MPSGLPFPTSTPSESPLVTVQYNDEWTPFIVGALERLLYGEAFDHDDQEADGQVIELILIFANAS